MMLLLGVAGLAMASAATQPLILLGLDGFRWDYFDIHRASLPNLLALRNNGSWVTGGLQPVFLSKTFPNHFSLVTGLYTESHGILSNNMYDPVFDSYFNMQTHEPRWWNGGEPVWNTVVLQGGKSATYFWPGSEVEIRGTRPSYYLPYDHDTPFDQRVDTVLSWLRLPEAQRPSFISLYSHEPDSAGHAFGPTSPQVAAALVAVDNMVGRLINGLAAQGQLDTTNIIVTADHGMSQTSPERVLYLDDLVDLNLFMISDTSPAAYIWPNAGQYDVVLKTLRTAIENLSPPVRGNVKVYAKEDMPTRWFANDNRRCAPIVLLVADGWTIIRRRSQGPSSACCGAHGYDNEAKSMRSIFFGVGPAFLDDGRAHDITLRSVDVYPLMCHLLGVRPAPNNGTLATTAPLLRKRTHEEAALF